MKNVLCTLILFSVCAMTSFGQSSVEENNERVLRKVAWHYDLGLGFQSYDPTALKASLKANNYSSDLSSNLIMLNYGLRAVFFDKFSAGLNFETGTTSDFVRSGTSVSLTKVGAGLKLGYDIWSTNRHKISVFYQLGVDLNGLNLTDDIRSSPDFGSALDQRTSQTLFSGNVSNRFSVRYDYLFKQKQNEKGVFTPGLVIELGYTSAGNNSWDDVSNGPVINNSGLFVNLVFSSRLKYFKSSKTKG